MEKELARTWREMVKVITASAEAHCFVFGTQGNWIRLQLDNDVKNRIECITYTPKNKDKSHLHPTRTQLLTNQGPHIK